MSAEPVIKGKIGDGREILFMSKQDCILFAANFGSVTHFEKTFNEVYGKTDNASVMFNYYRGHRWKREIAKMLTTTKLSDGSTLAKAIEEKSKK